MTGKPLPVTQPSLPPLEELLPLLERIWQSRILTTLGPLHQELEAASFTSNGSAVAMHGWMPAPTSRCWRRRSSSTLSRSVRV